MKGVGKFSALAALAASAMGFGGPVAVRNPQPAGRRSDPKEEKPHDPYFGIKSKGRRGARARMVAQGRRNITGRNHCNPFKHPLRKKAFNEASVNLGKVMGNRTTVRNLAMKAARRAGVAA